MFRTSGSTTSLNAADGEAHPAKWDRKIVFVFTAFMVVALIPLLAVQIPPLSDYPNHLARIHILLENGANRALAENYIVQWGVIPNLAFDVVVLLLGQVMPLFDAGRLFVGLLMVLNVLAVVTLHYAVYRCVSLTPALVFLTLYNQMFSWGSLSYLFGVALALMLFAAWIRTQHWRPWPRLALFSAGALVVFSCHLIALAGYGLLILGFEAWRLREDRCTAIGELLRRGVFRFGQFVVPALLVLLTFSDTESFGGGTYITLLSKIIAIASPFHFFLEPVDLVTPVLIWGALGLGLVTRTIRFAPELRYPLILLFVLALLAPRNIPIFATDMRLFILFAFVAIAGLELRIAERRVLYAVFGVALALFVWRIAAITPLWRDIDARFSEFRAATTAMAEGTRLLAVRRVYREEASKLAQRVDGAYLQMPTLAVIDRAAFVPFLFTAAYQPVKAHPRNAPIDQFAGNPIPLDAFLRTMTVEAEGGEAHGRKQRHIDWPAQFDYVVVVDFGIHDNPAPEILRPIRTGSFFVIYENTQRSKSVP